MKNIFRLEHGPIKNISILKKMEKLLLYGQASVSSQKAGMG